MTILRLLLFTLLLFSQFQSCGLTGEPIVLGYYPGYELFPVEKIPYERFTHICHAFVTSDPQGVLKPNKLAPNQTLTRLAAQHNVPVILSIGGWGDADGFEMATSTQTKMDRWVEDAVHMMHEHGYHGLDVDWEFPRDESTRDRFTKLVLALRKRMNALSKRTGQRYLITSAVTARPHQGKWIDGPAMEQAVDFLNVMTYDFAGPWSKVAAHHSPLEGDPNDPEGSWRSTTGAMTYWNKVQKFPKEKLVVGIPLYGRGMPVRTRLAPLSEFKEKEFFAPFYRDFIGLKSSGWSEITSQDGSPWLISPPGQNKLISFDSPTSARKTGRWSRNHGYGGIFFWGIGQDAMPDGSMPVMSAAIEGFREPRN